MKLIATLLATLLVQVAWSQKMVKGIVVGEDNSPIANATISVKGSNQKSISDQNGTFSIIAQEGQTLVCTHVGYTAKEAVVTGMPMRIMLVARITTLEGVTVNTGYQELPKERAAGSFEKIDNALLNRSVTTDVLSKLEGSSSVYFSRARSATPELSIRGLSTLSANAKPLIVVDNFPYEGDINSLNPNDVESITLLKDAAAASIWGVRSGNGVIVITTRRARYAQPFRIGVQMNYSVEQKPDIFKDPMFLDASSFIDIEQFLFSKGFYDAALSNTTTYPVQSPVVELLAKQRAGVITAQQASASIDALRSFDVRNDYTKYLYRLGNKRQYALNMSGGSSNAAYMVSAGYDDVSTTQKGNDYQRATVYVQTLVRPSSKWEIQPSVNYSWTKNISNSPGTYKNILPGGGKSLYYPYLQLADGDGNPIPLAKDYRSVYTDTAGGGLLLNWKYNPIDELNAADHYNTVHDLLMRLSIGYHFSKAFTADIKGQWEGSLGYDRNNAGLGLYATRSSVNLFTNRSGNTVKYNMPLGGILKETFNRMSAPSIRLQVNYNNNFGAKHQLTAMAGGEAREVHALENNTTTYGWNDAILTQKPVDYITRFTLWDKLGTGTIQYRNDVSDMLDRYLSVYANAAYTFDKRYTVTASARKDASNLFGVATNQKWVPLWSAGVVWQLSNERFYPIRFLPTMRLRTSYGFNGNIKNDLSAVPVVSYNSGPPLYLPYASITTLSNPQLRWETVRVINVGLDFATGNNRLSGSVEYYTKQATDLLSTAPIDPTLGLSSMVVNIANLQGKGVDVKLNAVLLQKAIGWNTQVVMATNTNKVTRFLNKLNNLGSYVGDGTSLVFPIEGEDPYSVVSFKWGGLDGTGDPVGFLNGAPSKDYTTITTKPSWDDLVITGSSRPKLFGNMLNEWRYKNISLSVNLQYKFAYYFRRSVLSYYALFNGWVGHSDFYQRWQKPGDEAITTVPAMIYPVNSNRDKFYQYSETTLEKGDHIRLQDISLSWEPQKLQSLSTAIKSLRLSVYASNIGILWRANKRGIDPDYRVSLPNPFLLSFGAKLTF